MENTCLKKRIIETFSTMPYVDGFKNNKIIIVTAAGMIIGNPLQIAFPSENKKTCELSPSETISFFVKMALDSFQNDFKENTKTYPNDGCIVLKDVTIISGSNKSKFHSMAIFFDQIIGITIGEFDAVNS